MYKACIFDLDGTLADTVESIANVANQILERFGAPAQPVEDYKYHAGDGRKCTDGTVYESCGSRYEPPGRRSETIP